MAARRFTASASAPRRISPTTATFRNLPSICCASLDVLFLDALRYKPHPTHSTVDRSVKTVEKLAPRRAFFTHICHDLAHERAESLLPPHIRLAYDGLEILVGGAV